MTTSIFLQQIFHVFKKLHMATLVTGDSDALYIFFNGCFNNFFDAPVVTKGYDLRAFALKNAAPNMDGGVMSMEKRSRSYDTDLIFWLIVHSKRVSAKVK